MVSPLETATGHQDFKRVHRIMNRAPRTIAALFASATLAALLTACTSHTSSGSTTAHYTPSCDQQLSEFVEQFRAGNNDADWSFAGDCAGEQKIATDYMSHAGSELLKVEHCDELLGWNVRPEAIALLEEDGWCSSEPTPALVADWPEEGLGWDDARDHAGTVQRVCGPLMSARETADGTFLNVGRDYPSPDRFTFVFWGVHLEPINMDEVLCGSGEVYLYDGVGQMELNDPAELEIWPASAEQAEGPQQEDGPDWNQDVGENKPDWTEGAKETSGPEEPDWVTTDD